MSTSHDLYCIDCRNNAYVSAPWDPIAESALLPIIRVAHTFKDIHHDVCNSSDWLLTHEGVRVAIAWLVTHATHRLAVRNEYGEVYGSCAKPIVCDRCRTQHGYCYLDVGHSGECSSKRSG
jgi:hypothetical protein